MVCWWTVSHWWMLVPRLSPALATAEQLRGTRGHQQQSGSTRGVRAAGRRTGDGGAGGKYPRLQTEASLLTRYTANNC